MRYRLQILIAAIAMAATPVGVSAFPLGNGAAAVGNSATADTNTTVGNGAVTVPVSDGNTATTAKTGEAANGQPSALPSDDTTISRSVAILLRLFVLAVVLESALAVIFQWRPYLANIDGKAVNPLLTFVAALILVRSFSLDEFGQLISSYNGGAAATGWTTSVITALVIAGGSAGVNRMLRAVGYRPVSVQEDAVKPPRTEGWIAVIDTRPAASKAYQDYDVLVRNNGGTWAVVGSIERTAARGGIFRWMLRDHRRFPTSGGLPVPLGTDVEVAVQDRTAGSTARTIWGPHAVGAGAIVDIRVTQATLA
jgi:hypothetical protein